MKNLKSIIKNEFYMEWWQFFLSTLNVKLKSTVFYNPNTNT